MRNLAGNMSNVKIGAPVMKTIIQITSEKEESRQSIGIICITQLYNGIFFFSLLLWTDCNLTQPQKGLDV